MLSFIEYLLEDRVNQSQRTQVATTGGTYRKTGEWKILYLYFCY